MFAVDGGRKNFVLECLNGLDESSRTGSGLAVADVRLDAADSALEGITAALEYRWMAVSSTLSPTGVPVPCPSMSPTEVMRYPARS